MNPTQVYVGSRVNVTVLVRNEGTEVETFDLSVYCNSTGVGQGNSTEIGHQQMVDITSGDSRNVYFDWNVSGLSAGTYMLEAVAHLQSNVNLGNNTFELEPLTIQTPPAIQPLVLYSVIAAVAVLITVMMLYRRQTRKNKAKTETEPVASPVQDQ